MGTAPARQSHSAALLYCTPLSPEVGAGSKSQRMKGEPPNLGFWSAGAVGGSGSWVGAWSRGAYINLLKAAWSPQTTSWIALVMLYMTELRNGKINSLLSVINFHVQRLVDAHRILLPPSFILSCSGLSTSKIFTDAATSLSTNMFNQLLSLVNDNIGYGSQSVHLSGY